MTAQPPAACALIAPEPDNLPAWVPPGVSLYLRHTAAGLSLRALAREQGCHASTVLRQVRRLENRRDDPLVDNALARLDQVLRRKPVHATKGDTKMTVSRPQMAASSVAPLAGMMAEDAQLLAQMRPLASAGAVLVVAPDMPKAVIMREDSTGQTQRLAVLDRALAEAMALRDWIICQKPGRVACYVLTQAGQAALRADLALHGEDADAGSSRRARYGQGESPVSVLARRRDRDGHPFLSPPLVIAAERLREDFVTAQLDGLSVSPVDEFLVQIEAQKRRGPNIAPPGTALARRRVLDGLRDLGPGLGDVALRCCCFHEGVEAAEIALGWSARSGKIVLRIALHRLRLHYDRLGDAGKLMG